MKTKTIKFSTVKKSFFFALVISSMALTSCENKAVSPKAPTEIFGDDPPKDTTPPKGG